MKGVKCCSNDCGHVWRVNVAVRSALDYKYWCGVEQSIQIKHRFQLNEALPPSQDEFLRHHMYWGRKGQFDLLVRVVTKF